MPERRKIQKVGYSTFSVSLPKKWVDSVAVKPGDHLYLYQNKNRGLRILSEEQYKEEEGPREYEINVDKITQPKLLQRLIYGLYIQGVDAIRIFSKGRINGKRVDEIRNITRTLHGLGIIEASSNQIIIKCSIDPTKFNILTLIKRLSVITSTMLDEATEALLKNDHELATSVIDRDNEADNVYLIISRFISLANKSYILMEKIGLVETLIPSIRVVSKNLERIADHSENMSKITLSLQPLRDKIGEKELVILDDLVHKANEIFHKALNAFFSRDVNTANEVFNLWDSFDSELQSTMENMNNIPYFRAVSVVLGMVGENSVSIAGEAFHLGMKKDNQNNYLDIRTNIK